MGRTTRRLELLALASVAGILIAAITLLVAIGTAAVDGASAKPRSGGKAGTLKAFKSCDALRKHYRRHRNALGFRGGHLPPMAAEDFAGAPGTGGGAQGAAPQQAAPSSTNVQEAGVDEPDLVKAHGDTIFALDDGRLFAVDVSGEAPVIAGSLKLPGGEDSLFYGEGQLLIHGDRALVIAPSTSSYSGYGFGTATRITEVAIGDPANMEVRRTSLAEGSFVSARLTGETARLVISTPPPLRVAAKGKGRALVPRVRTHDHVAGKRTTGKLVSCSDVRHPSRFAGADMLTVLTVDMTLGLPAVDTDAVMTAGEVVYASPTSLYVATERWFGGRHRPDDVSSVYTRIHRFDASQPGTTRYVASGAVPGFMLSQWSMSEHEGVLRVATTTAPPWREGRQTAESESFVTTLAVDGERLRKVGQVGGLGRGEEIYAVRMMGDRGYVVTFRQTDPLYVLDLSDATKPRVLGELKIPGYSAYLHPVGEGFLLGVGQDATRQGATRGVQVSLFDVRDPKKPVRIDRESFGRASYSEIEHDHHAFAYFPEHGLAMIPLDGYATSKPFTGAVGLRVNPHGPDSLGRVAKVSHGDDFDDSIRRSLLVGDRVYTVSGSGIAAHDPATLAQLGFVGFGGR